MTSNVAVFFFHIRIMKLQDLGSIDCCACNSLTTLKISFHGIPSNPMLSIVSGMANEVRF